MSEPVLQLDLPDDAATARFGVDLARVLRAGMLVALEGELGAGKTALARAVIRSLSDDPLLDVPSPTYALVQSYETAPPVLHADLYRLSNPAEADELGLTEALGDGVVIVEWADRGAGRLPQPDLRICLLHADAGRRAIISGSAGAMASLSRSLAIRSFLARAGWGEARRAHLQGDASTRTYETVMLNDRSAILMNAPPRPDGPPIRDGRPYSRIAHLAESVVPFVALARALRERGFAAPEIYAADLDAGLLLLEHLGRDGLLDSDSRPIAARYEEAARLLAVLHAEDWPRELEAAPGVVHRLTDYDRPAMLIETELLIDWYLPHQLGRETRTEERQAFVTAWNQVLDSIAGAEKSLVLRDYHSPNIIWREAQAGRARIGLLDFQDALIGPCAYDLASLAQDARVTIDPGLERAIVAAYCAERARRGPFDRIAFERDYAVMAAQRNVKILGIFVRLDRRDGKPAYIRHLPRLKNYLERVAGHPALGPVTEFLARHGIVGGAG